MCRGGRVGLLAIYLLLGCCGVPRPKAQLVAHPPPLVDETMIAPEGPGRNQSLVNWIDKQYAMAKMASLLLAPQVVLEARNLDDVPLERADCSIPELCSLRLALEVVRLPSDASHLLHLRRPARRSLGG